MHFITMQTQQLFRSSTRAAALLGLIAACAGDPPRSEVQEPPPILTARWTDAFLEETMLMAEEISVRGPHGLLQHVAVAQDPENHQHTVRATSDGLLQVSVAKDPSGSFPVRAQIDALALVGMHRIEVIESQSSREVSIEARGNVYWRKVSTGEERRVPSMSLRGELR